MTLTAHLKLNAMSQPLHRSGRSSQEIAAELAEVRRQHHNTSRRKRCLSSDKPQNLPIEALMIFAMTEYDEKAVEE